mgnify:FL=1|jgi:hypothetical protein|tara:strand:- start:1286 stop:1555 length:270 start_codon:yes stop_codon:yes gene_type:complete
MTVDTKCYKILGKKEVQYSTLVEVPKDWSMEQVQEYIDNNMIDTWTEEDTGFDTIEVSDEKPELIDDEEADEISYDIGMFLYNEEEEDE